MGKSNGETKPSTVSVWKTERDDGADKETERRYHRQENQEGSALFMGLEHADGNGWVRQGERPRKNKSNCRSKKTLRKVRGVQAQMRAGFPWELRPLCSSQSGDRLPAHTGYRLLNLLWEDESLA